MSQENVEVVLKGLEDANERDFDAGMDALAEDVTLVLHGQVGVLGGTASGKAAVREWFRDWFEQFDPDYRMVVEESRDFGGRVFVLVTHHGRGRGSGVQVEHRVAYVCTVREGEVSRLEIWANRDARNTALETVGLRE
jgi:ketosteroid isomerase-like protein